MRLREIAVRGIALSGNSANISKDGERDFGETKVLCGICGFGIPLAQILDLEAKMKKILIMLAFVFGLSFWVPQTVRALDVIHLDSFQQSGSLTGEILMHYVSPAGGTEPTYCLERDETVTVPGSYYADYAIHPMTTNLEAAAWLVEQYSPSLHGAYPGGYTALETGVALQFAVWNLDGESTAGLAGAGTDINTLYTTFTTAAGGHTPVGTWQFADLFDLSSTPAQIYDGSPTDRQGMLVLTSTTSTSVPEPATMLLLGLGLVGLAGVRGKFRK